MRIGENFYRALARIEQIERRLQSLGGNPPTTFVPPLGFPAGSTPPPEIQIQGDWEPLLEPIASKYGLEPRLLRAVLQAESGGDPRTVSPKGAIGLMQLMPATAKAMGVEDPFDPAQNLEGGARYLRFLLDTFGELELALAAYNAGPGAIRRYGGIPPYPETQHYVRRVLSNL